MSNRTELVTARALLHALDGDLARIAQHVASGNAQTHIGRARGLIRGAEASLTAALQIGVDRTIEHAPVATGSADAGL